ncbi:MAG: transcription-repair coupling factor [Muribaculaceae bacterium]|nr:transcription-repair coupling factor [Muribaculaceae bacterium]
MEIRELCEVFNRKGRLTAVRKLIEGSGSAVIDGLAGSSAAMLLAALPRLTCPYLIVVNDLDEAGYMYNDLCQLMDDKQVLIFPSGYKRDIKYGQIDAPNEILRTEVLNRWYVDPYVRWVVTYPEALAERVRRREDVEASTVQLRAGGTADLTEITSRLRELGFTATDYVYEPGQYSVRGSILDVFSYSNELPYRIDFWGDDIDSIRTFNVETQLSEERLEQVSILNNSTSGGREDNVSLLDYIGDDTIVLCRSEQWLKTRIAEIAREGMSASAIIADEGDTQATNKVVDADLFKNRLNQLRRIAFVNGEAAPERGVKRLTLHCKPQGIYHKNFDLIGQSFTDFLAKGYKLIILSDSAKQIERLHNIFEDRGDAITFEPVLRTLHEGFVDDDLKLCVFTDHQIFDRFHKYNLKSDRARSGKLALSLKELNQIEKGDYIVHEDLGVGKFGGLIRTSMNGTPQEMIKLTYLNGDEAYVSIHSLHKLSKYRSKEGEAPRLNRLGSNAWAKIKSRTKSRLKDIARELIRLYAARREQQGFAYTPDGYLQQELEASFIYEDTPDQLTATQAVKADMESNKPMDRLICGDVGFGKTEIAIRAAFKAATDGKQTAVLVPTTVLAFQHWRTFSERLQDFPVRVDYLSRARKPKEVKQILADLKEGTIDILIGTHKLIGKTVQFHDLGLLVVDEEQKFGVAVKDKLKQMKLNVDTLTMSATPIPRTLQFSLMGARDLSTLTTPPANRYPILTTVGTLNDDIVAEAINFELSRNGQVFFVNHRIEQLEQLENMIHRVVPDARVAVGHGQMPPERLEQTIIDFGNHDYDVLLSTTIIENGIDMPNVNTIIINNADRYGLSDLHQLRGRVGRSSRKAFCYLLVPPGKPLATDARRRLQAIESFSDLGAGIQIAMQDLDIRGAGNLLGAEQSGFIADLGYETYQRVLKEAVTELRTEEFAPLFTAQGSDDADMEEGGTEFVTDCVVDTDLELMFPASYVPQENERITLYRELDNMETDDQVEAFEERMVDRFGKIPDMAAELIRIVPLRRTARRLGIEKLVIRQTRMHLFMVGEENVAYYQSPAFGRLLAYLQQNPKRCAISQKNGRRSIIVSNIPSVSTALSVLRTITHLESV